MSKTNKIMWNCDDLQVKVTQEVTEDTKVCTINFEDCGTVTFHRPVDIETLQQIVNHYSDISKAVSQGMAPIEQEYSEDDLPF